MNIIKREMKGFIIHSDQSNFTLVLLLAIFLIGCSQKKSFLDYKDIKMIKIGYLPKEINTYKSLNLPEEIVMYEQTKYEVIKDSHFFLNLATQINKFEFTNSNSVHNYRIICYIYFYNNSTPNTLYLGENHEIVYNENQVKYNKEIFELFENRLYK